MTMSTTTSLGMMESKLPPGFRFHPRDEELVCYYLTNKISGFSNNNIHNKGNMSSLYGSSCPMLVDVDLNKCEPWDLPEIACVGGKEWYFFSLRDRKYATGQRTNRATQSGYWKATGKDRRVTRNGVLVGMRKTLVFYQGRAPKGKKTEWVMHEFRTEETEDPSKLSLREDWVLCRVFYKSREIVTELNTDTICANNSGLSSLPALMDTYINFEQAPLSSTGYEQVPCFSNFPTDFASRTSAVAVPLIGRYLPAKSSGLMEGLTEFNVCDKSTISAVLDHFTKLEGSSENELPPNIIQGSNNMENIGVTQMWNYY